MNRSVVYIGGYKSSGLKAEFFRSNFNGKFIEFSPDYDTEDPVEIQKNIREAIQNEVNSGAQVEIIGSSTGGMTALVLMDQFNLRMYLINPLLAKEQFFDQEHPVGPSLKPISEILKNQDYTDNDINIYLAKNDQLLNPAFTKEFAEKRNINLILFEGDHVGEKSLDMILEQINR